MVIIHHDDCDGIMSAAIVKMSFSNTEDNIRCIEMNYNKTIDFKKDIEKDEKVYIVDFSIKPEEMNKLLKRTKDVTWIDHHKSAIAMYNEFSNIIDGVRVDGISANALCYMYLNNIDIQEFIDDPDLIDKDTRIPTVIKYANSWDVWRHTMPKTTEFVTSFNVNIGLDVDKCIEFIEKCENDIDGEYIYSFIEEGTTMLRYQDYYAEITRKRTGREGYIAGHKCYIINAPLYSSKFFAEKIDEYDLVCGYNHNGEIYTVSLYSNKENIDCSEIAKLYGGGGHKGAAGFSSENLDFIYNSTEEYLARKHEDIKFYMTKDTIWNFTSNTRLKITTAIIACQIIMVLFSLTSAFIEINQWFKFTTSAINIVLLLLVFFINREFNKMMKKNTEALNIYYKIQGTIYKREDDKNE